MHANEIELKRDLVAIEKIIDPIALNVVRLEMLSPAKTYSEFLSTIRDAVMTAYNAGWCAAKSQ